MSGTVYSCLTLLAKDAHIILSGKKKNKKRNMRNSRTLSPRIPVDQYTLSWDTQKDGESIFSSLAPSHLTNDSINRNAIG